MPKLLIQAGEEKGRVYELADSRTPIGRSVPSGLQIVDRRMSRHHAEISLEDGHYYLRDMGSKNGTQHNGRTVDVPVRLRHGDLIGVGDTTLVFEDEPVSFSPTATAELPPSRKHDSTTSYRLVEENLWGSTQGELRAGTGSSGAVALASPEPRQVKDSSSRLEIILQVTEAIRSTLALEQLLEQIMEIVNNVFHPDSSYLLLLNASTGELIPKVIKNRGALTPEAQAEVRISSSIVERCIRQRVSLLVSDAAQDDRFAAQHSVIINRIRTAMVAPLISKDETLGVIYVDTRTRIVPYAPEELELLTGIANQAALALVNARLHEQIVAQHKMAREMEIARAIQMNLLPKVYPDLDGYEISAMSLPAKQVGGDYYDFIQLPDGRHALAVADVSGKGVPAAILTATTRSYLQSETRHPSHSVAETAAAISRMVHRDVTNDMYVTMALAYLDPPSGQIEYVNAGHTHPIIVDPRGEMRFLKTGGLFLGIMPDTEYESGTAQIGPGEVLLLQTDGVVDIQDSKGVVFGADRLYDLLRRTRHLHAEEIRNHIYNACLSHRGDADQFDDFTLIVLKRREDAEGVFDELELDEFDHSRH